LNSFQNYISAIDSVSQYNFYFHFEKEFIYFANMRRPVADMNSGDDMQQWFRDIPLVTKTMVLGTLACGIATTFGFIPAETLVFYWPMIRYRFQIWRLFTPFLFAGTFSFPFAMHVYILYENCRRYENVAYNSGGGGTSADFLWMILICMAITLIVAYIFNFMYMSECILYSVMYVWSRREPEAILSIFGFKFKSMYLPWIYLAVRVLMGGSITLPLAGIVVGHVYFFLVEVMPSAHGYQLVKTPQFCIDIARYYTGNSSIGQTATTGVRAARPAQGAGYNWGRGHVLGAS
jgi:hypothetical protein